MSKMADGVIRELSMNFNKLTPSGFAPPLAEDLEAESKDALIAKVIALNILLNEVSNQLGTMKKLDVLHNYQLNLAHGGKV